MAEEEVVIVGAGITGLATALALHRVGVRSLVLEKSEQLRTTGSALYLFPNAWLALDALRISHKLTPLYPPLSSGSVTDLSTGSVHQIFSGDGEEGPRVVHRKALLEALAEELPPESIRFFSHLTSIHKELGDDDNASLVVAHLKDGTTIKSKVLIGCDGLHSVIAKWLGLPTPVHSGRSAFRGVAVYPGGHGLGSSYQQFVDAGNKGGITPLNDTEVYWILTCHSGYDNDPIETTGEVIKLHTSGFPPIFHDVVRNTDPSTVSWVPLMFRNPWSIVVGNLSKGNVVVAGDAMHPMTPDLGQGGGSALEDAVVLGRHVGNYLIDGKKVVTEEMAGVLNGYVKERRWRAAGLVAGSYVAGWVQQSGSNWWRRILRVLFQKYLFRLGKYLNYDCGQLPPKC